MQIMLTQRKSKLGNNFQSNLYNITVNLYNQRSQITETRFLTSLGFLPTLWSLLQNSKEQNQPFSFNSKKWLPYPQWQHLNEWSDITQSTQALRAPQQQHRTVTDLIRTWAQAPSTRMAIIQALNTKPQAFPNLTFRKGSNFFLVIKKLVQTQPIPTKGWGGAVCDID